MGRPSLSSVLSLSSFWGLRESKQSLQVKDSGDHPAGSPGTGTSHAVQEPDIDFTVKTRNLD